MIVDHMHIVPPIAARLWQKTPAIVTVEDLAGAGYLGLVQAARKWDGARKFNTYASHRIRGAMLDYLRSLDSLSKYSRHKRMATKELLPMAVSLDAIGGAAVGYDAKIDDAIRLDVRRLVERTRLTDREFFVLSEYFFMDRGLREIGAKLSITESGAAQIKASALTKLRATAETNEKRIIIPPIKKGSTVPPAEPSSK